jgi:hypothetical protein
MNIIKKALLLLLAALMVLPLAACGEKPAETAPVTEKDPDRPLSPAEQVLARFPKKDFDGASYHVLWSAGNMFEFYAEETTGEILNDEIFERNAMIEEYYDVLVTGEALGETYAGGNTHLTRRVRSDSLAWECAYQVIGDHPIFADGMARDGLFYNLYDMPWIDFNQPYWDPYAAETYSFANRLYFTVSSYVLSNYADVHCLYFNKKMADDLAIPDMYEMVWAGEWTLDRMVEYSTRGYRDMDGNGRVDFYNTTDTWGTVFWHPQRYPIFLTGLGYTYSHKDEDGNFVLDIENEENLRIAEEARKLYPSSVQSGNWESVGEPGRLLSEIGDFLFYDNNALFLFEMVRRDMTDAPEYGILPLPKLNEEQENYITSTFLPGCIMVPVVLSEEEIDRTGFLLEAFSALSEVTTLPTYIEKILEYKKSPDPDSTRVLQMLFKNVHYDIVYHLNLGNYFIKLFFFFQTGESYARDAARAKPVILWEFQRIEELYSDHALN